MLLLLVQDKAKKSERKSKKVVDVPVVLISGKVKHLKINVKFLIKLINRYLHDYFPKADQITGSIMGLSLSQVILLFSSLNSAICR